MKRRLIVVLVICAAALSAMLLPRPAAEPQTAQKNARTQSPGENTAEYSFLFPGLDSSAVTAVFVSSPDASFEFLCEGRHDVSVNGHEADGEVFRTLLSQIEELAVTPAAALPEGSELLLKLSVVAGGAQYDASFYADGEDGSHAFIQSGGSAPQYHLTAGWRVGTLMMTCEGTRIQDERGREAPAD